MASGGADTERSGHVRHDQPALDALRAIAVLAVLTTHVAFQTGTTVNAWLGPVYARLDVGVAIFFVLSGYLLGRPFVAPSNGHGPALRPYALAQVPAHRAGLRRGRGGRAARPARERGNHGRRRCVT